MEKLLATFSKKLLQKTVCENEWVKPICRKPAVKCSECKHQMYSPITDQVIYDHLTGKHTIGIYPLLKDETTWFLAVDFDKSDWQDDSLAFLETCKEWNVPSILERSRSGNGAHVWIFFEEPIAAYLSRKLGTALLTHTMEKRYQIGLDSYDRLFPNQDSLPKGGLGNLIALPFQRLPRKNQNSVFIDQNFIPYEDQWLFLSQIKKLKGKEVTQILNDLSRKKDILGEENDLLNKELVEDWNLFWQN